MRKFVLAVLMLSAVLPIAAQQRKTKKMSGAASVQTRAASAPETLTIVPTGENAPESIIRIVSMTTVAGGKHKVVVAGGSCRNNSKNRLTYIIDTKEPLAKGNLFFIVPVDDTPSKSALRRLNSGEATQYANCQWINN